MFLCYDLPWSVGAASRIVEIVSEEGTVNNAVSPAATSMASISGTLATQQAVANAFSKMLLASDEFREEAQAAWSSMPNVMVFAGLDRRGMPFTSPDMNNSGGGAGARTFADGIDTGGIFHSMASTIPNVETMESRMPILIVYRRQRPDSQGDGRFRGGAGIELALIAHRNPEPVTMITIAAFVSVPDNCGLAGGTPGAVNYNAVLRSSNILDLFAAGRIPRSSEETTSAEIEVLPAKSRTTFDGADLYVYLPAGGGGYGDPLRRDPERVLVDLRHELLSEDSARKIYGVMIENGAVNAEKTAAARAERLRFRLEHGRQVTPGARVETASGGEVLHPVADTVEAARVNGEKLLRCTVCQTRLANYTEDYTSGTLVREFPITELNHLNEWSPPTNVIAREFCCPGCGTALAVDIQREGEPLLPECTFVDSNSVSD